MDILADHLENQAQRNDVAEELWLLGQPPLGDYLDFVRDSVVGGEKNPRRGYVDEWRKANDHYAKLEKSEAGIADQVEIFPTDTSIRPLVKTLKSDPRFRRAFDKLPTRIAMVELEKVMAGQAHIDLVHARRLADRIGKSPSPKSLLRFCLPAETPDVPLQVQKTGSRSYTFWSETKDFRFHEAVMLKPEQISGYDPIGPLGGILALMVGHGSNFLSLIEYESRLVIHNGHHRAYALLERGITHAPCLIQTATRIDELEIAAARSVVDDPAFYFQSARPPVMKDFFDPRLRKRHPVKRSRQMIKLSFEVRSTTVTD